MEEGMNKVGILTFHYADNCGAQLQLLAMYRYLECLGYLPEVIDYQSSVLKKRNAILQDPFFRARMGWRSEKKMRRKVYKAIGGIVYAFRRNVKFFKLRKEAIAFKQYYKNNPLYKSNRIHNINELVNASKQYDCIIVGSDQVWNIDLYNGIVDEVYFLQSEKMCCRKVGYALSAGNLLKMDALTIRKVVNNFDRLSAREQQLADQLSVVSGLKIPTVLDPVFLLAKDDWVKLCPDIGYEKYIFFYVLEYNKELLNILECVKSNLGDDIKVVEVGFNEINKDSILINQLNPKIFLSLVRNAECIISNSFHATAFSIIFEKSFYTLKHSIRNNRMESLLNKVGLLDRCVSKCEELIFFPIDYKRVGEELEKEILHSKKFLEGSIGGETRNGEL